MISVRALVRRKRLARAKKASQNKKKVKFNAQLTTVKVIKEEKEDDSFSCNPARYSGSCRSVQDIKVEIKSEVSKIVEFLSI